MKRRLSLYRLIIFLVVCCSAATATLNAQAVAEQEPEVANDLPSAEQIVEQYIEAVGGREKLKTIKSTTTKAKLRLPQMGMEAPLQIWVKSPGSIAVEVELPGAGTTRQGADGTNAWEINPMTGVRLLKDKEKEQFLKQADLQADLNFDKYYKSMKTVGETTIDGEPHYEVKLITVSDDEETRFYNAKTHLLAKVQQTLSNPMGEFDLVASMTDYQDVDGMMLPFLTKQDVMGQKMEIAIESVEMNGEIEDSRFEVPEEAQELLDKEAG